MKTFLYSFFIAVLAILVGCDRTMQKRTELAEAPSFHEVLKEEELIPTTAQGDIAMNADTEISNQNKAAEEKSASNHIIKTAHYKFQVDSVESSTTKVEQIASQHQAFIASMDMTNSSSAITNTFVIRVPAARFDALLEALSKESVFTNYKKISTEDVTEEYVDIQIRLKAKKEVRDRYIDILRNKAKTVKDILEAEHHIRVIQEEIESMEGRLRFLQNKVVLSTIHLEIYQKVKYVETPDPFEKSYAAEIKEGVINGWNILTSTLIVLINIWPLTLLGIFIVWKRKWLAGKLRKSKQS